MTGSKNFSEVRRQRAPGKTWGAVLGAFLSLFFLTAFFSANTTAGFILLIIILALFTWRQRKRLRKETESFAAVCNAHGVTYKPNHSDPHRAFFFGLSETSSTVVAQFRISDAELQVLKFDVSEVLNVELDVGDKAVYRAGPIATLSSAAVGGMAFGGAGAIVGSLASGQIGRGKLGAITLQLRVDDIEQPVIRIPFLPRPAKSSSADTKARLVLAEKWTNVIEVLRSRLAKAVAPSAIAPG